MLTFFHAPMSRSESIRWLLIELGAPYETVFVDIRAEGGAPEDYRRIHPHKKAPAIRHDGVVIHERAAICIYLADAFPQAGLAPPMGDPMRGPYLTSLVYTDAVIDPALTAKLMGWTAPSLSTSYGVFEDVLSHLETQLGRQPYAAGDRFTAADTQLASAVNWGLNVAQVLPARPVFQDYLARISERAGFKRFMEGTQAP
ncbi:glutathione S-transferase family protein [Phenylobacterium sp.]|jgi:glutathione S-transferase|uniref:glutathione S-transferase family protein n=1 Tax=Phenylobacterium sp. TaxID=1871053 RepID=UPI002E344C72|nr:glutathione S-transferase family protein [Phenylobacterium sp.]HEX2560953.1 glutathione S-transferase family protein [Phenylobacterium sp.]